MNTDQFIEFILLLILLAILAVIYITPSIVAFRRHHPNRWMILLINLVFGSTLIGWGIAMIWAMRAVHLDQGVASGGQSGLNLFVNDTKKIEIMPPPLPTSSGLSDELARLHQLLVSGAISQTEYDGLKAKIIGT